MNRRLSVSLWKVSYCLSFLSKVGLKRVAEVKTGVSVRRDWRYATGIQKSVGVLGRKSA